MESMASLLEEARKLHDTSIRKLAGVLAGEIQPAEGYSREDVIEILQQDILGSRKMLKLYGWRDDANLT